MRVLLLSASVFCLVSSAVHAADYSFDGGAGTADWLTPQNWSSDIAPIASDNAAVNNGSNVLVTGSGATASKIRLGTNTGFTGYVTVSGINAALTANEFLVSVIGAAGMTIQNGGSASSGTTYVGQFGGSNGTIDVLTNGTLTSGTTYVGSTSGSTGRLTVSGGSFNGTTLNVGNNGTGSVLIDNGSTATIGTITVNAVGSNTASITVAGAGSQMNTSGDVVIGAANSGIISVSNGGLFTNAANVYVGLFSGSSGVLDISNGGQFSGNNLLLGANGGVSGAALVTGSGSVLSYSGNLRVGNVGSGALTVADGADVSGGAINVAQASGSTGTINIGAAAGDTPTAAGTISAPSIQFGSGAGTLNFNHTDTNYNFAPNLVGAGTVNVLSGATALTGNNNLFTGTVDVAGGMLIVNGNLGGTISSSGSGRIRGNGTISQLTVDSGGTAAPGNSIGTLNAVNVVFNPGSTYEVELNSLGQSDLINAMGTATLNGGTVVIVPFPDYSLNSIYTILTAAGGVTGTFDATSAPLLDALLTYDANNVYVMLTPSASALNIVGETPNQIATARAASRVVSGNRAIDALYASPDIGSARRALDLLSGEIHASIKGSLLQSERGIADMIPERAKVSAGPTNRTWVKSGGSRSQTGATGNTASLERRAGSVMAGVEHAEEGDRYGFALGGSESDLDQPGVASKADITSVHAMVYAGTELSETGASIVGGVSAGYHDIETKRHLDFGAFDEKTRSDYTAQTYRVFGEVARAVEVSDATEVTPYVQGAYTILHTGSFSESGDAGLSSDGDISRMPSTTVGLKFRKDFESDGALPVSLTGGAAWQRNYGDTGSRTALEFKDAADSSFSVSGAPYDRDSALLNLGIGIPLSAGADLSLTYGAAIGQNSQAHAAGLSIKWKL